MKTFSVAALVALVAMLSALVLSGQSRAQSSAQMWEYKTVVIDASRTLHSLYGNVGPFGSQVEGPNEEATVTELTSGGGDDGASVNALENGVPSVVRYFDQLGSDGWELASAFYEGGSGYYVFKRLR